MQVSNASWDVRQKLSRLYRAIEDGFAELDDDLRERIQILDVHLLCGR